MSSRPAYQVWWRYRPADDSPVSAADQTTTQARRGATHKDFRALHGLKEETDEPPYHYHAPCAAAPNPINVDSNQP